MTLSLRPVREDDLPLIETWLREPHVVEWWLTRTTVHDELEEIRKAMSGAAPFEVLVAEMGRRPVGWGQWYRWWDDPDEAAELGVGPDDLGIDYAIGAPTLIGQGLGTELIAALVGHVRERAPNGAIVVEPDASNFASRRVLEKNGFELVDVRRLSFETEELSAIYRRSAPIVES